MSYWLAHVNWSDKVWLHLLNVIYKSLSESINNLGTNLLLSSSINYCIKVCSELFVFLNMGFNIVLLICSGFKPSSLDWKLNSMWSNSMTWLSSITDISDVMAAKN